MSDGNFNRALLPHTPYASGLKAGKALARMKALDIFTTWIQSHHPDLPADQLQPLIDDFRSRLEKTVI